jgi:hypothetical protein
MRDNDAGLNRSYTLYVDFTDGKATAFRSGPSRIRTAPVGSGNR